MDGTTLLKVFRVVRGERQVSHYPQLAQHQIEVVDGRTYIAVAHAHLRLQRYAIPDKAELFDMLVQSFNPLLVRFRVKANRQVTAREVINLFVGLEPGINPLRQPLFVLNAQQHAIVTPQNLQLRNTH